MRMMNTAAAATTFVAFALGAALAHAEITLEQSAQFAMLRAQARTYEHGDGVVPKDPVRAQEKYCEAARLGDAAVPPGDLGRGILQGRAKAW